MLLMQKRYYAEPPSLVNTVLHNGAKGVKLSEMPRDNLSREFFRKQGKKGGKLSAKARLAKLTPEQRSEVGRKAAAARWGKKGK